MPNKLIFLFQNPVLMNQINESNTRCYLSPITGGQKSLAAEARAKLAAAMGTDTSTSGRDKEQWQRQRTNSYELGDFYITLYFPGLYILYHWPPEYASRAKKYIFPC